MELYSCILHCIGLCLAFMPFCDIHGVLTSPEVAEISGRLCTVLRILDHSHHQIMRESENNYHSNEAVEYKVRPKAKIKCRFIIIYLNRKMVNSSAWGSVCTRSG